MVPAFPCRVGGKTVENKDSVEQHVVEPNIKGSNFVERNIVEAIDKGIDSVLVEQNIADDFDKDSVEQNIVKGTGVKFVEHNIVEGAVVDNQSAEQSIVESIGKDSVEQNIVKGNGINFVEYDIVEGVGKENHSAEQNIVEGEGTDCIQQKIETGSATSESSQHECRDDGDLINNIQKNELLADKNEMSRDNKALLDAFRALMEDPDMCRRLAQGLNLPHDHDHG